MKFMKEYGSIAQTFTVLLKKDGFQWNEKANKAFQKLKIAICSTPVLALPDFNKPFVMETNGCYEGVGAVFMLDKRPKAY